MTLRAAFIIVALTCRVEAQEAPRPIMMDQAIDHTTGRIETGFICGVHPNNVIRVEGDGTGFKCPPERRRTVAPAGVIAPKHVALHKE